MTSTTTAATTRPKTRASRDHRPDLHATGALSVHRLNAMRFGYAFMGVGLAIVKWPMLIQDARSLPVMDGVVTSLLTALSILALVGLRYPVRMLPILLFEVSWKVLWLGAVAIPRLVGDDMNPALDELLFNCTFVVIIVAVIPWRYATAQYLARSGDPWRDGLRRRD